MRPTGAGKKRILIVGEAPGADEDRQGEQFVGVTGKLLRTALRELGADPRRDCVFTNALICRPPGNVIKDPNAVEYCRPNLIKTIQEVNPEVIILLGGTAVKSLIGFLWKEDVDQISRWAGWRIPCQRFNCWVCPTFHPSYVARSKKDTVVLRTWVRHLSAAVSLAGSRPWKKVPDYKSQVEVIYDENKARERLMRFWANGGTIAVDYETNMLKPDHPSARIVCCSVCWEGKETIAYPWTQGTANATRVLLMSDKLGKIASNMKFEDRWTQAILKRPVVNWKWDTMLSSHVIDPRPSINSIKFQAFVLLGQESYDDHVKPYLKSDDPGGYGKNRIHEVDQTDLMVYCGLDSLLEYHVAMRQMKELGVT